MFIFLFLSALFVHCSSTVLQDGMKIETPWFPTSPNDISGNVTLVYYAPANPRDVCFLETFLASPPEIREDLPVCLVLTAVAGAEKCLPERMGVLAAEKGFSCMLYATGMKRPGLTALALWRFANSPIAMFDMRKKDASYILDHNISYAFIEATPNYLGKGTSTYNFMIFLAITHGLASIYLAYITSIRMVRNIKVGRLNGKPTVKTNAAGVCAVLFFLSALIRSELSRF
jgi:hypothetical protein